MLEENLLLIKAFFLAEFDKHYANNIYMRCDSLRLCCTRLDSPQNPVRHNENPTKPA